MCVLENEKSKVELLKLSKMYMRSMSSLFKKSFNADVWWVESGLCAFGLAILKTARAGSCQLKM